MAGFPKTCCERTAEVIRAVGASSVVLSTISVNQQFLSILTACWPMYKGLMAQGISAADIVQMSQTNPAKLLGSNLS
jgi:hypothetical protein